MNEDISGVVCLINNKFLTKIQWQRQQIYTYKLKWYNFQNNFF